MQPRMPQDNDNDGDANLHGLLVGNSMMPPRRDDDHLLDRLDDLLAGRVVIYLGLPSLLALENGIKSKPQQHNFSCFKKAIQLRWNEVERSIMAHGRTTKTGFSKAATKGERIIRFLKCQNAASSLLEKGLREADLSPLPSDDDDNDYEIFIRFSRRRRIDGDRDIFMDAPIWQGFVPFHLRTYEEEGTGLRLRTYEDEVGEVRIQLYDEERSGLRLDLANKKRMEEILDNWPELKAYSDRLVVGRSRRLGLAYYEGENRREVRQSYGIEKIMNETTVTIMKVTSSSRASILYSATGYYGSTGVWGPGYDDLFWEPNAENNTVCHFKLDTKIFKSFELEFNHKDLHYSRNRGADIGVVRFP